MCINIIMIKGMTENERNMIWLKLFIGTLMVLVIQLLA